MAAIMADFLQEMGVPRGDIRLEDQSRNTYENLREVRRMVRDHPFLLVATASDLRRAMAVAHKLDMAALPAPACIWATQRFPSGLTWVSWITHGVESLAYPSERRWSYLQWAYHEYVGYMWYAIHDRI